MTKQTNNSLYYRQLKSTMQHCTQIEKWKYFIHFQLSHIRKCHPTDYGRSMKPFSIEIQNGLGQTNWADKFWSIWRIFGRTISTHFGTENPLSMFFIIQPIFLQKLSIYIHIANIYLGLGFEFEFGPQRIT